MVDGTVKVDGGIKRRAVDDVDGHLVVLVELQLGAWRLAVDEQHLARDAQRRIPFPRKFQLKLLGACGSAGFHPDRQVRSRRQRCYQTGYERPQSLVQHDGYMMLV